MVGIGVPGPGGSRVNGGIRGMGRVEGRIRYREIDGNGAGNQIHGIQISNLNEIKVLSLVFLWPMFCYWKSTTQLLARYGNTEIGKIEENKNICNFR